MQNSPATRKLNSLWHLSMNSQYISSLEKVATESSVFGTKREENSLVHLVVMVVGGNVYLVGSRDLGLLYKYRHKRSLARRTESLGKKDSLHGRNRGSMLKLPIGSIVKILRQERKCRF